MIILKIKNTLFEIIFKILVIHSCLFLIVAIGTKLIETNIQTTNLLEQIFNLSIILGFASGIPMVIMLLLMLQNPYPTVYKCTSSNFNYISSHIEKKLLATGFEILFDESKKDNLQRLKIFKRCMNKNVNYIFFISYCEKLTENIVKDIEEKKNEIIENLPRHKIDYVIPIFCVNEDSPTLTTLLNNNILQLPEERRLFVGICLQDNTMTVATQKYGLYEDECKKLKKYFLQLSNEIIEDDSNNI